MPQPLTSASAEPQGSRYAKRKQNHDEGESQPTALGHQRRRLLRVEIPDSTTRPASHSGHALSTPDSGISEADSLFDEPVFPSDVPDSSSTALASVSRDPGRTPALLTAPPISGLFFTPALQLPQGVADTVTSYCLETYFQTQGINQIMLFGRSPETQPLPSDTSRSPDVPVPPSSSGLPPILLELLSTLDTMLLPFIPSQTHALLFPQVPTQARQAIINLYRPGEGISAHVDLLGRFGDGIIGVSLGSGCVMQFAKAELGRQGDVSNLEDKSTWDIYLPDRSVIVLSNDARYKWTHGIGKHKEDFVALIGGGPDGLTGRWIERGVRLSVTFRWLLPGVDVIGEEDVLIKLAEH